MAEPWDYFLHILLLVESFSYVCLARLQVPLDRFNSVFKRLNVTHPPWT